MVPALSYCSEIDHTIHLFRMLGDYRYYREILSRFRRPLCTIATDSDIGQSSIQTSYGLGSGPDGTTISQLYCGNTIKRGPGLQKCLNFGVLVCSQCSLVKYCSGRCQRQHWPRHRLDCEHPYMNLEWKPEWVAEGCRPLLSNSTSLPSSSSTEVFKNSGVPAYDCLRYLDNEGIDDLDKDLKICMTAAGDIRNLVCTVNNLPFGYHGTVDILLNNNNTVVLNRMLVILCVLLSPGPTIEESAELAIHLMYSACLPETAASYVRYCVNHMYGEASRDRELTFQLALRTRGNGKIYSAQPAVSIKRPGEMFSSTYTLSKAMASIKEVFQDPFHADDRDKLLFTLKPGHRLALYRFWQTGVLAPFSVDLKPFKCPNRLMFTPQGEWMGMISGINPLHGWDVAAVGRTGLKNGCDPTSDILGCLFFHMKAEFQQFTARMKELHINLHLLQYEPRLLSKGISAGILPAFREAFFDRVDLGDMADQLGVVECLVTWTPLLNKDNDKSCVIMHSKQWYEDTPMSIARNNPRALKIIMERCRTSPSFKSKFKNMFSGSQALFLARLVSSLDAFVDHEPAFLDYLRCQEVHSKAYNLGINIRHIHTVHSKRVGISLKNSSQKLPNLSKEEFYDLFILGGADLTVRFAEFDTRVPKDQSCIL